MRKSVNYFIKEAIKVLDFIVKYWLEVLFGLIAAGMGFWIKRYIDFEKKLRIQEKEEFYQKIQNDIALGY